MNRTSKRERKNAKSSRPEKESSREDLPPQISRPVLNRRPILLATVSAVSLAWFVFMLYVAFFR